ncbi:MAG: OB-fold nucleic acid binding domain-containing protein, partial [Eubacteriales bacterium]|nr:OB-fold nucleic acid binding domain-containing protein [Eubacteriales bacterium]
SRITKKGSMMGILTLEDLTGQIEGLVFPKVYEKYSEQLSADQLVILAGKLSFREDEEPKLLVDTVQPLSRQTADEAKKNRRAAAAPNTPAASPPARVRDPKKPYARLSDKNIQSILAYPAAAQEVEVDESLLDGVPKAL